MIRYILPSGDVESIYGVLREFNNDYVKLEGFLIHFLNRKTATIIEVGFRE